MQNTEVSVTLLKSDFTTDAALAILKILGTNKWGTCDGASSFKRNFNKDGFIDNFLKLS